MTNIITAEDDDISCNTGLETLPATNVRRVTLSPAKLKMQTNNHDDHERRSLLAEVMWIATMRVNNVDEATGARLESLQYLQILADENGNIDRARIDAIIGLIGGNPPSFLAGATLSGRLWRVLNEWNNNTNSYARRGNLASLIRSLLALPPATIETEGNTRVSDISCNHGGMTSNRDDVRAMVHGHATTTNLATLGGTGTGTGSVNAAVDGLVDDFAGGLHLSSDSTTDGRGDSPVALLRRGEYAALQQMNPQELVAALASRENLRLLLLEETGLVEQSSNAQSTQARAPNMDDLSSEFQGSSTTEDGSHKQRTGSLSTGSSKDRKPPAAKKQRRD